MSLEDLPELTLSCQKCGKSGKLQRCGSCKAVFYCSRDCQAKDWSAHKKSCSKLKSKSISSFWKDGTDLLKISMFQSALRHFSSLVELNPPKKKLVLALKKRSICFMSLQQYEDALRDLQRCWGLTQSDLDIAFQLAECYQSLGVETEAMNFYSAAIALNPKSFPSNVNRALLYRRLNKLKDSIKDLNQSLKHCPPEDRGRILAYRGSLYLQIALQQKDASYEEKAITAFTRVITSSKTSKEVRKYDQVTLTFSLLCLAILRIEKKDYLSAFLECNRAFKLEEGNKSVRFFRGVSLFHQGKLDVAKKDFVFCQEDSENQKKVLNVEEYVSEMLPKYITSHLDTYESEISGKFKNWLVDRHSVANLGGNEFIARAEIFFNNMKFQKSIENLNEAIRINPYNSSALFLRGRVHKELRDLENARKDVEEAIRLSPREPNTHFNLAIILEELGDIPGAIESYSKSIHVKPDWVEAYCNRGFLYKRIHEFENSLADFSDAIRINKFDAELYNNRGAVLHELREYEKAIVDYDKSIGLNPNSSITYCNRGRAYQEHKNFKNAMKDYNMAIMVDPNFAPPLNNRGLLHWHLKEHEKAIEDFSSAVKIEPNFTTAYFNRALVYYDLKEYEKAIEAYDEALGTQPRFAGAICNRGRIHFELKRYEEAIKDFDSAIIIDPEDSIAYSHRGNCFRELGEIENAKLDLLQSMELRYGYNEALSVLSYFFISIGERRRRVEFMKRSTTELSKKYEQVIIIPKLKEMELEEKRVLEKYFKFVIAHGPKPEDKHEIRNLKESEQKQLKEMNISTKQKTGVLDPWLPFLKDDRRDEEVENDDVLDNLREFFQLSHYDHVMVQVYRKLGEAGKFGRPYLIRGSHVKTFHQWPGLYLRVPYHRNIATYLGVPDDKLSNFDPSSHPDYEEIWKAELSIKSTINPIIVAKNHRKSLHDYVELRKDEKNGVYPLNRLEVCYILGGLLEGISHLLQHKIVHQDLSPKSVFVDAVFGRVCIESFGSAMDLRDREGFEVMKKEEMLKKYFTVEQLDFEKDGTEKYLDFSKHDLFSVGMIGYFMIDSFENEVMAPFGCILEQGEKVAVVKDRKQENYVDLKNCDPKIAVLIKKLLIVDPQERIGHVEAVEEIREIEKCFEEENRKLEEI